VAGAFRQIPYEIRGFRELGLPPIIEKICEKPRGLVLVTGRPAPASRPRSRPCSTRFNRERHEHIITIEDPVEYLHSHKNCLVNQRELHADTLSFGNALRSALREDPDVVLIGEMRDFETVESALRIAETGHLTFATLHTNSAASSITASSTSSRRTSSRRSASSSRWCSRASSASPCCQGLGQGRALAMEILVPNSAIRNLIREDKVHQIYGMMQTGQAKYGMQTFNQSLASLYFKRMITLQTALARSS